MVFVFCFDGPPDASRAVFNQPLKMTFIHTNHATHRLKTRGIPPPDIVRCVPVGKRDLRRIRQLCPVNFNKDEYSYFRSGGNVYVTKEIKPDTYLLITAFMI